MTMERTNSETRLDFVSLGEMMVMLAATEAGPLRHVSTFQRFVGGSEANVAIGLARLGHRVGWISRLGDDEFGHHIYNFLRGEGVDVSRVIFDREAPTGIAFKELRELGARKVLYYRRGSAASRLSPSDLDRAYLTNARYLHLSGITPALSESCRETVAEAIRLGREAGQTVTFDVNIRLRLWDAATARKTILGLLANCDVVLPGQDEAELLVGEADPLKAAEQLLQCGPRLVVMKLGAEGAMAVSAEGHVHAPGVKLSRIVDPVGAGDGFAAGFFSGQLRGLSMAESLRLGNVVAAFAMAVRGDVEGLPTWEEVQGFDPDRDVAR